MGKTARKTTSRSEKAENTWQPAAPLEPLNQIQAEYITNIKSSPITFATGYPGTSKTYIPARIAALWLKQSAVSQIILMRPAVSASKSVGFAKGTHEEKMKHWLRPILGALSEEFSHGQLSYMLKEEIHMIDFVPLENVKGNSWSNAFIIVDEAEDCTMEELKSIVTRIGKNSTLVLCGDLSQCDLPQGSGLGHFLDLRKESPRLTRMIQHVDFNDFDDIVRSDICREIVMGFAEVGVM
tara:strand:+ start:1146 stop:1862 length:717 start_codon:yes stop_codon:yes gene_type:complete